LAMPKNNTDEAIVVASSHVLQFHRELAEVRQLSNPPKAPNHFFLKKGLRKIQNINTTKIPTMQDLADVIMILSIKPTEVATLRIIHYKPGELNPPEWYKPGYSWYCIRYIKNKGEAKNNPEPRQFLFMEKNSESKRLRKIGDKHASRVHGGQNSTSQHLEFLSKIAIRYKIDCFNSRKYYTEGNTSNSDLDSDPEPKPETLAPTPKPINKNTSKIEDIYDLYE
ncbi:4337_t:CDS:2, partial [Dentiscutata erythropus]